MSAPIKNKFMRPDDQDEAHKDYKAIGELRSMLWLLKFAKPFRIQLFFAILMLMVESILLIFSAGLMGKMVEQGLLKSDIDVTMGLALQVVGLEALSIFSQWSGRSTLAFYAGRTLQNVRAQLFYHLQKLPMEFFDRTPQGRVITRMTHDVEGIEEFFTTALGKVLGAIFTGFVALIAMVYSSGWLGFMIMGSLFPVFLLLYGTRTTQGRLNRAMGRSTSAINGQLSEFISGMEVIRAMGLEDWSQEQFTLTAQDQKKIHLDSNWYYSWSRPVLSFLCTLPIVGLVWFGGKDVLAGAMTVGVFVAFLRYCERFINPVMTVARDFHVVQQALINAERVAQFLKRSTEEEILGVDGTIIPKPIVGDIAFNNVSLIYSGARLKALDGVSFEIKSGEKIGIVGKTGSGKSSVISLLVRLYDFLEGDIQIDGQSIRSWPRSYLRRQIGIVAQDPVLFRGTIKENLMLESSYAHNQILACAKETGLFSVLDRTGLTLDSPVLENGVNLSVGERQLIVLTRMLLRDPAILILDEATANIDPFHENIVHQAVEKLLHHRTCIIIAHRLATLKACDRVLVFLGGKLVEEGPLNQLEQKKGHFRQLQDAQGDGSLH